MPSTQPALGIVVFILTSTAGTAPLSKPGGFRDVPRLLEGTCTCIACAAEGLGKASTFRDLQ